MENVKAQIEITLKSCGARVLTITCGAASPDIISESWLRRFRGESCLEYD
jgi:hypothetical protein